LQTEYIKLLAMVSIHCSPRIWSYAQVLITGAILTRGQRTVTAVLRVMGLGDERHFVNYHRVLVGMWPNRSARWATSDIL
jgi:hypothetical protein